MRNNSKILWHHLSLEASALKQRHLKDLFRENPSRFEQLSFEFQNHLFDFSKNFITTESLKLFEMVAQNQQLEQKIDCLFDAKPLYENQIGGLHTALRYQGNKAIYVNGYDVMKDIKAELLRMKKFVNQILDHQWLGFSSKPIKTIVNIGIGGSDLGPLLVSEALQNFRTKLSIHFVSNGDGLQAKNLMNSLDPETTLFIIVSKTFSTQETLTNADSLIQWFLDKTGCSPFKNHVIGVSAANDKMTAFGIPKSNQFQFWDFVGGRYSIWSTVGLVAALAIGFDNFQQFLIGAYEVDEHFRHTELPQNIPFIMAFIDIFYIKYWQTQTRAILPYHSYLQHLPAYLQQVSMESLGKSVSKDAKELDYNTGNIIWGELGSNGQHAFFQLLHQGKFFIPVDFIVPIYTETKNPKITPYVLANALAQAQVLMQGKTKESVYKEMLEQNFREEEIKPLLAHRMYPGNRPSTMILLEKLSPKSLGHLLAIYEHKVFVQSVIWNINPFDQWGVELGKELANNYVKTLKNFDKKSQDQTINYLKNRLAQNINRLH